MNLRSKIHMKKNNLIFIGMPAVGKSTVGVVVAKRLGKNFIDTDLLIQEQEKKLLREINRGSGRRRIFGDRESGQPGSGNGKCSDLAGGKRCLL